MDTDSISDTCNSTLPLARATADRCAEEFSDFEWYVIRHSGKYYTVQASYFINHPTR